MKWADLYRQTKIRETVVELLTQQYEMARIQEAKEIPSVKVLDPASTPERRESFLEADHSSGYIAERVAGLLRLFHQELVGPLGPG